MNPTQTYPLHMKWTAKVIPLTILGFLTLLGFFVPFAEIEAELHPAIATASWFAFLGLIWFKVLTLPLALVLHSDDTLEFRSKIFPKRIPIRDLERIEPVGSQHGYFRFKHQQGSVVALQQFDGFHELAAILKAKNPRLELRGC